MDVHGKKLNRNLHIEKNESTKLKNNLEDMSNALRQTLYALANSGRIPTCTRPVSHLKNDFMHIGLWQNLTGPFLHLSPTPMPWRTIRTEKSFILKNPGNNPNFASPIESF